MIMPIIKIQKNLKFFMSSWKIKLLIKNPGQPIRLMQEQMTSQSIIIMQHKRIINMKNTKEYTSNSYSSLYTTM